MKRAFVVGRRCGTRSVLLVLEAESGAMPGPWTIRVVVSD